VYCCGGAKEHKGSDGEEKKDGDAAAALPHAVAPVGAQNVYWCGGAEERKGYDGDAAATFAHAVAPVGAPSSAAAGLHGERQDQSKSRHCAEKCRFGKDQSTQRDSVPDALPSATGASQQNRDWCSSSPELIFKT